MKLPPPIIAVLLALACHATQAQEANSGQAQDPIADRIFPPELVMRHQKAIQLTDAQSKAVIADVKKAQARLVDLQWELQRAMEPLLDLLGQAKVDEAQVLAQLDKVLAAEREVKRTHLTLATQVKNLLLPEQQRLLRELRANVARASDLTRQAGKK